MKKLLFFLIVFCLSLLVISCSGGGGGGGASGESLDELISDDETTSSSSSSNTTPSCPLNSTYTLDGSSTADNTSITDTSSITDNSDVDDSTVRVCSTIIRARVDNSTVDNSTIIGSTVTNSTLDNSSILNNSTIDNSTITNSIIDNSTVDNNSIVINSTIRNSIIDNSTIDNMTIINISIVEDQRPLQNDNLSGFISSDRPTVSAIYLDKDGSLQSAVGLSNADSDTNIYISFSEAMDTTSITAITSGTSCTGTVRVSSDSFSNCVPMSSSPADPNSTNKIFTFDPSNLSDGTVYKIRVTTGVKDGSGNTMSSQHETGTGFTVSK